MTFCPGKVGPGRGHHWNRSLASDLAALETWGTETLITLMEAHELEAYRVADLGERAEQQFGDGAWLHLPLVDRDVPDAAWEKRWQEVAPLLHQRLNARGRIVVHCLGGLGRTGLVACRLLVENGVPPDDALARVRLERPGAVETPEQVAYVQGLTG